MTRMEKIPIAGLLPDQIVHALSPEKKFRGAQIFKWLSKGASSFDEMTDIGKDERESLSRMAVARSSSASDILRGSDGTVKARIALADSLAVEAVILTDGAGRKTACLSSQAGCAMGCAFCKTGTLGLARDLKAHEIVEQFFILEREAKRIDNVVFMGMGEPLMNIAALRAAIGVLSDKRGRDFSIRRITVSTCGITEGIRDLARGGPRVRLAVSLTAANQSLRETLMPCARANPLPELRAAIEDYAERSGRRVTLEAALLSGVNTSDESAEELALFARGMDVNVNVIPWNKVEGLPFAPPSAEETAAFMRALSSRGVNATLRASRGGSVAGACGQLGVTARS